MKRKAAKKVAVALRPEDRDMKLLKWLDPENFNPGYMTRSMHLLPKRGDKAEWQHTQDYWRERDELPKVDLDGCEFQYDAITPDRAPSSPHKAAATSQT